MNNEQILALAITGILAATFTVSFVVYSIVRVLTARRQRAMAEEQRAEIEERLNRIEHAIDAVATEVERVAADQASSSRRLAVPPDRTGR